MATGWQKQVKKAVSESSLVFEDKMIAHKDGTVSVKRMFFYTHGATAEEWMEKVAAALDEQGVEFKRIRSAEHWNAWPKDSYFVAVVGPKGE